ncbi:MAG TPA: deoxyribonuclease IV [Bacillus bacterium]|uniref:Endonuclease 4 n=1 Tax=Siminovitchia fordii TaxID=254759 RepID=A0ABQ4K361_9BACI|nr:deoxyribonuclease IV [Siminovitchia fordii]GIN20174.1 putative endonuclease 4 [Siminovitchia fordii]HBZ09244.1 deoxyribonuclease IV [Bacillus sp. (in: firmicutes)]
MKFGCHLSIRDGYLGAAKKAYAMNAGSFQYFPKNPRSLSVKDYSEEDAALCRVFCKEKGILSVSHSPYPTSLTPHSDEKKIQVIDSLLNDLEITEACGSIGVVVHFGKHASHLTLLESYQLMIELLDETLSEWEGDAKILLENSAGIPGTMGTTLEELVQIRRLCEFPEKIGFCLDTCHAFSCGLWNGSNWNDVLEKGVALGYFDQLEVIHFNNSKYPTGQGKDRHAPIFGKGCITEDQFDQLVQTPELAKLPFILETPKEEIPHEKEIQMLQEKWGI